MISDEDLDLALDRIARTPDGELLYRFLQKTLLGVLTGADIAESALRENLGERRFAAKLMGRMAKGIEESGGRTDDSDPGKRTERPVVFLTRQPVDLGGRRSVREHLLRSDPELQALGVRKPGPGDD